MALRISSLLLCAALLAPLAGAGEHGSKQPRIELGERRLFTSAAERQQLDRARDDLGKQPEPRPAPRTVRTAPVTVKKPLPQVSVQGIVKRSGGEDTVWVNGTSLQPGQRRGDITVRSARDGRRARLVVGGEHAVNLKPGQTFDPNGDRISDRILIRKGP